MMGHCELGNDVTKVRLPNSDHWAYQPLRRPEVPHVKMTGWSGRSAHAGRTRDGARVPPTEGLTANPIDAFLTAAQEKRGLQPLAPADKRTLLRRVSLDLIGLPPTAEQVRAFLNDSSKAAYDKVVDSLLASPRYGERWGRHWMDVWRYSDWYGRRNVNQVLNSQRHLWRWRDWIIESLNQDKGYDRMVLEMLAGDEIAPSDPETLRADRVTWRATTSMTGNSGYRTRSIMLRWLFLVSL